MTTITDIHNSILNKIKSGSLKQKPKWQFVLNALLFVLLFIAVSSIFFYLISFAALVFHEHLIFDALSFGPRTVFALMHTVPFLLIILLLAIFFILNILVRHFAFAYMKPVTVTLGIGFLLTFTAFALILNMDRQFRIAHFGESRIPPLQIIHSAFRDMVPHERVRGTIISAQGGTYVIKDRTGRTFTILLTDKTRMSQPDFDVGDTIGAILEEKGEELYAIGIHKEVDEDASSTPLRERRNSEVDNSLHE